MELCQVLADVDEIFTTFYWRFRTKSNNNSTAVSKQLQNRDFRKNSSNPQPEQTKIPISKIANKKDISESQEGEWVRQKVVKKRHMNQLFIRGDSIVMIAQADIGGGQNKS